MIIIILNPPPTLFGKKSSEMGSKFEARFLCSDEIFCIQTKTQQNHIIYCIRNTKNEVSGSTYEKPASLPMIFERSAPSMRTNVRQ